MKAEAAQETHRALFGGMEGLWREVMGKGGLAAWCWKSLEKEVEVERKGESRCDIPQWGLEKTRHT